MAVLVYHIRSTIWVVYKDFFLPFNWWRLMLTTSKGIFKNSSHAFGCQLCWEVEEYHPITSEFHPLGGRDWRVIFLQDQPKERKVFSGVTRELKKEFIFGQGILRMVEAKILMIGFLYRWTVIGGVFILLVPTQTLCTLCVSSGFFFPFFFFFYSVAKHRPQNKTIQTKKSGSLFLASWNEVMLVWIPNIPFLHSFSVTDWV